jgi:hypothetical protein
MGGCFGRFWLDFLGVVMTSALEQLRAARDLISAPERWTQHAPARNVNGEPIPSYEAAAVCFCSVSAVHRVGQAWKTLPILSRFSFPQTVTSFNDTHTHAEVIALFDAAIAELERAA